MSPRWRYLRLDVTASQAAIIETAFRFLEDYHYDWYTLADNEFRYAGRIHPLEDALVDAGKQNKDPVYESVVKMIDDEVLEQEKMRQ